MAGSNINRVIITGNLTKDPELQSLPASGTSVCTLRIACNGRRKNSETGMWEDQPNYFDVTVWGPQGENCAQVPEQGPPRRDRRPAALARVDRPRTGRSAKRSISSLNPCSSSAGVMTLATGTGSRAARARRRATSRSTPATSSALRWAAGGRRRHSVLEARGRATEDNQLGDSSGKATQTAGSPARQEGRADFARRKPCPYCRDKIDQVDYKDLSTLRRFISERGKIRSRRITGACRRHQSQVARAVKRARELALLPYVAEGSEHRGGRGDRDRRPRPRPLTATVATMPQAILLARRRVARRARYGRRRVAPATCATTCCRASSPSRRPRRRSRRRSTRREDAERAVREAEERARENAAVLGRTVLTIPQQAGDDGRLFGSVTTQDIADAIRDARGIRVDRRKIHLEEPIRQHRHLHGRGRGRRRSDCGDQDHGRRCLSGCSLSCIWRLRPARDASLPVWSRRVLLAIAWFRTSARNVEPGAPSRRLCASTRSGVARWSMTVGMQVLLPGPARWRWRPARRSRAPRPSRPAAAAHPSGRSSRQKTTASSGNEGCHRRRLPNLDSTHPR